MQLCTVPGVGPVTAGAIMAFAPDLCTFASGRNFAAWLGLVPRQRSTGGKARLGLPWMAHKTCRDGYAVYYARAPRLFADLELAHSDGRFARLFRMLVKVDLLILDDWGPDRLTASQRRDLMEIVEDRHGRGSLLITSQLPVPTWHEVIGEPTLGDAILDRIVHNAYRLELDGPSMRKIKAVKTTEPSAQSATDDTPKGARK